MHVHNTFLYAYTYRIVTLTVGGVRRRILNEHRSADRHGVALQGGVEAAWNLAAQRSVLIYSRLLLTQPYLTSPPFPAPSTKHTMSASGTAERRALLDHRHHRHYGFPTLYE